MGRPSWVVGVLVLVCVLSAQQYNLRRLFQLDEVLTYSFEVEASKSIKADRLYFDKAVYRLNGRLKTAGVREGVATMYLSFPSVESVSAQPTLGPPVSDLTSLIAGAKVQNRGVITWDLSAGKKKGPLPWFGVCFSPTDWTPPMPDRLLPIGGEYSAELILPVNALLTEPGWPSEVRVPVTLTFLGSTRAGEEMRFRIARKADVALQYSSADGKGSTKASLTATGWWALDAVTGRLVECDLVWVVRLDVTATKELGGSRVVDCMVHLRGTLMEVGSLSGPRS